MSSITTAVPSGRFPAGTDWCIQAQHDFSNTPNQCANSTAGQQPSDFETLCCAGSIISATQNLYSWPSLSNRTFDLADVVCCLEDSGPQQTGLMPIQTARSQCPQGSPTPLLSLAATNTGNAVFYPVTYPSASVSTGASTTVYADSVGIAQPTCLWVYTKTGVPMRSITVAAAAISTPAPTTDVNGITYGISTATSTSSGAAMTTSASTTSSAATAPSVPLASLWFLVAAKIFGYLLRP